jgi:HD-like signal output (HDOD) protein
MNKNSQPVANAGQSALDTILSRIEKIGDMPIFNASVNRIRMMSSSKETEVTELANEIGKDVNLTTKLLKVANSPYYARNNMKVGVASRAIVMLGFDTVRNITLAMKVIDSFQFKHPSINMSSLLVKSYLSAGFVRELAMKTGAVDPEETYTCGLLHNLGEIVVAVTLPDEYLRMRGLVQDKKCTWDAAQQTVLGATLKHIAQEVLKKWQFPNPTIQTVSDYVRADKGAVRNKQQLNSALSSYGATLMDCLYTPETASSVDYQKLLLDLQEVSGLRGDVVNQCLSNSFKMSCDLASEYGLDKKLLRPKIVGAEDDARNKTARSFAYLVSAGTEPAAENPADPAFEATATGSGEGSASGDPVQRGTAPGGKATRGDTSLMVNVLHDITMMITQHTDINMIFSKILEGMQHGVGYDHAMLCLLTPDRARYKARFAVGPKAEALKKFFSADVNPKTDLFSRITLAGDEVLVKNVHDDSWQGQIRPKFVESVGATTFVAASIKLGDKSIGFFYADNSQTNSEITPELYRGFIQLVSQARIALSVRR